MRNAPTAPGLSSHFKANVKAVLVFGCTAPLNLFPLSAAD